VTAPITQKVAEVVADLENGTTIDVTAPETAALDAVLHLAKGVNEVQSAVIHPRKSVSVVPTAVIRLTSFMSGGSIIVEVARAAARGSGAIAAEVMIVIALGITGEEVIEAAPRIPHWLWWLPQCLRPSPLPLGRVSTAAKPF